EMIKNHRSVRDLYQERLIERGTVTQDDCVRISAQYEAEFEAALDEARASDPKQAFAPMHGIWRQYQGGPEPDDIPTRISAGLIRAYGEQLTSLPEGFSLHPKVARLLNESRTMTDG